MFALFMYVFAYVLRLRSLKSDFEDLSMQYKIDMQRKDREVEAELEKRIMQ